MSAPQLYNFINFFLLLLFHKFRAKVFKSSRQKSFPKTKATLLARLQTEWMKIFENYFEVSVENWKVEIVMITALLCHKMKYVFHSWDCLYSSSKVFSVSERQQKKSEGKHLFKVQLSMDLINCARTWKCHRDDLLMM